MPGSARVKDLSTPVRRSSVRQARHLVQTLEQTPPSKTRDYYTTPTRSSARTAGMNSSTRTRRRGRGSLTPVPDSDVDGGPATRLKRPRQDVNYDEATSSGETSQTDASTDDDDATDTNESDESRGDDNTRFDPPNRPGTRSSARLRRAKSPPSGQFRASPRPSHKPRKTARLSSDRRSTVPKQPVQERPHRPRDDFIPDWQGSLPHLVWVQILTYASLAPGPFHVDTTCLLRIGRLCKATLDPAISVLYRSPPVSSDQKLMGLITLLRRPPSRLMFNYRARIRSLHLDLSVLSLAPNTYGSAQNLIQNLPQLSDVAIVHPLDRPPYRELDATIRWQYPEDLFRGLEVAEDASEALLDKTTPARLTSWVWNERFLKRGAFVEDLTSIGQIHLGPGFNTLRSIRFVNFQIPSVRAGGPVRKSEAAIATLEAKDDEHTRQLADALAALPYLTHLAFESSTSAGPELLPLLPRNLKHFELINCWEITSDAFSSFLATHGYSMESLVLHSNQALSLAFFTTLGHSCPRLTELRMNLLYYRHHESLNDSDPFYDHLLLEHQVPDWPTKLQILDMDHLRGWSAEAANMFFQSLLDNAASLRDLRHMSIRAMINIPWRERSGIRQGWQDKLTKVFLRPFIPPTRFTSLRQRGERGAAKARASSSTGTAFAAPSRRSNRLMAESSNQTPSSLRSSGRAAGTQMSEADRPGQSGPSDEVLNDQQQAADGLCDVVEIIIDNQKPREQQFGMDDFLDEMDTSASDDDADWKGGRNQA